MVVVVVFVVVSGSFFFSFSWIFSDTFTISSLSSSIVFSRFKMFLTIFDFSSFEYLLPFFFIIFDCLVSFELVATFSGFLRFLLAGKGSIGRRGAEGGGGGGGGGGAGGDEGAGGAGGCGEFDAFSFRLLLSLTGTLGGSCSSGTLKTG